MHSSPNAITACHLIPRGSAIYQRIGSVFDRVAREEQWCRDVTPQVEIGVITAASCDSQEKKEQAARELEDFVLQQRVLIGMVYENPVNDLYMNVTVDVTVTDGTIILKGYSCSVKNRTTYETIARSIPGVKDVVNEIFIKS